MALPAHLKRRGEIVGAICGFVCFCFAFFGESVGRMLPAGPPGVILPIVLLSALAGVLASITGRSGDSEVLAGFAPRVGIRAALVATLVGGAFTVLAATLHSFGIGQPGEAEMQVSFLALVFPASRPVQILLIALLGFPPSVFFGMAAALITAMLRTPPPSTPSGEPAPPKPTPGRSALFVAVLLLSILGYLSPVAVLLIPKPKPVAQVVEPPLPTKLDAPPAPKWRYERPVDFDTAEAGQIFISDRRILGEAESSLPVALSPDGRRFAYYRRGASLALEICDLETLDVVKHIEGVAEPSNIAWSPDSKMLLFVIGGEARRLEVLDTDAGRFMRLPQPKNQRLPEGVPHWLDAWEVLFVQDNNTVQLLNLETLRVRPTEESAKWKGFTKEQQDEIKRGSRTDLPATPRWQMCLQGFVRSFEVPANSSADWTQNETLQLAFQNPQKSSLFVLPPADVRVGDLLVPTDDGSRLVRIRDQQAVVFSFGVRAGQPSCLKIVMPAAPETSLSDALAKKSVCAFICAPLINPLNGKTVGPDREKVKALARVARWEGKDAEFWIEEDYLGVHPGDVIADLHTWEKRRTRAAGALGGGEWFAVIGKMDAETSPPSRTDAPTLGRELSIPFDVRHGAYKVEKIVFADSNKAQPTPLVAAATPQPAPVIAPTPVIRQEPPKAPAQDAPTAIVRRFILAHYEKLSRGDMEGYANDYSDPTDYADRGMVKRSRILWTYLRMQGQYTGIKQTVTSNIAVTPHSSTSFEARCDSKYSQWKDGRDFGGNETASFMVALTPAGPKIVKMRFVK